MDARQLRNYGVAFSDLEAHWPKDVKKRMERDGKAVILKSLRPLQRVSFLFRFLKARRRASRLDLSEVLSKGLSNRAFLEQQLEYVAAFAALAEVVGSERAVAIFLEVMDVTAREPLLLALPEPEEVRRCDAPHDAMRRYLGASCAASCAAGCLDADVVQDDERAFQFDVKWCVWLELARAMGVPEACLPNCHADDLVFPEYFADLGIAYSRTQTLARGGTRCNFRFELSPDGTAGEARDRLELRSGGPADEGS